MMQMPWLNRAATVLAGAAVLVAASTAVRAEDVNLAGTWNLSIESPQGTRTPVMTLTQSGNVVTGTYRSQSREGTVSGKVTGNDFILDVKLPTQSPEFSLAYKGRVTADAMQGTVVMGRLGDATFNGKRAASP